MTTLRKDLSFPNESVLLASVCPTVGRHLNRGGGAVAEHSGGSAQWLGATLLGLSSHFAALPVKKLLSNLLKVPGPQHLCLQMQTRRVAFIFKLARWFHLLIQHVYYVTVVATACSHHHYCYPHYQNSEVRRQVPMLLKGDDI